MNDPPLFWLFARVVCLGALVACGSKGGAASGDAGAEDAAALGDGTTGGDAGGDASEFVPAFKPDMGQIVSAGGKPIVAPKLVTVTWDGDPNRAALEDFGDKLTASAHWSATVGEYGIGPGASGPPNHVHVPAAPPGPDPLAISDYLRDELAGASAVDGGAPNGWPVPDDASIYVVYIPSSARMSPSTTKHSELTVGSGHVPYVLVDEGGAPSGISELDFATASASHEIAEAATNPHLSTDPALGAFDAPHLAWQALSQDAEIGDICETYSDVDYRGGADLPYELQRLWSNRSAAAGKNPCVPAPTDPYYNVAPLGLETVTVFMGADIKARSGYGYEVPLGTTKTIELGLFSDQPVGPWTLTAAEGSWFSPASNQRLTLSIAQGTGKNGDVAKLTVTANAKAAGDGNAVLVVLTSKAPGLPEHAMPILIGTYP